MLPQAGSHSPHCEKGNLLNMAAAVFDKCNLVLDIDV
jgi:hypothetical protein